LKKRTVKEEAKAKLIEEKAEDKKQKTFEDLSGRMQRKILKKRLKWKEAKKQKSEMINFNQSDEQILKKYKLSFPDKDEATLLQNIKYQRMVYDATHKKGKKQD
jgi:hypothetical protein